MLNRINMFLLNRNSPLNRSCLKESFTAAGRTTLLPTRVGGTRWVGHMERALHNLLEGYGPIISHLTRVSWHKTTFYICDQLIFGIDTFLYHIINMGMINPFSLQVRTIMRVTRFQLLKPEIFCVYYWTNHVFSSYIFYGMWSQLSNM